MTPAFSPPASERLAGLADRCEAASGPDRGLDAAIMRAVIPPERARSLGHADATSDFPWPDSPPAYTASLDAALSLVPDGVWRRINIDPNGRANVRLGDAYAVTAATPALALCAAALRARTHQETRP